MVTQGSFRRYAFSGNNPGLAYETPLGFGLRLAMGGGRRLKP
jgi:hypothetical protein